MAYDRIRVEIHAWMVVFKMLLVAFDGANRVAQQSVEALPRDFGRPGMDVVHKHVHLLRFKSEIPKKVCGNFEKSEGIETASRRA